MTIAPSEQSSVLEERELDQDEEVPYLTLGTSKALGVNVPLNLHGRY